MTRPVLAAALIVFHLLVASTGVNANCEACPNCDWENISISQGDACLNYWTCSGDTISCYYPSVANPGTYTGCSYSASAVSTSFSQHCKQTHLIIFFGNSRVGHLQLAPATSICRIQDLTQSVNLEMTLTTSSSQAAPLHMG